MVIRFTELALWFAAATREEIREIVKKSPDSWTDQERSTLAQFGFTEDRLKEDPANPANSQNRMLLFLRRLSDQAVEARYETMRLELAEFYKGQTYGLDYSGSECPSFAQFAVFAELDDLLLKFKRADQIQ